MGQVWGFLIQMHFSLACLTGFSLFNCMVRDPSKEPENCSKCPWMMEYAGLEPARLKHGPLELWVVFQLFCRNQNFAAASLTGSAFLY